MHNIRKRMQVFEKEMHDFEEEMHEIWKRMHDFEEEMHDFEEEMHEIGKECMTSREKCTNWESNACVCNAIHTIEEITRPALRTARAINVSWQIYNTTFHKCFQYTKKRPGNPGLNLL